MSSIRAVRAPWNLSKRIKVSTGGLIRQTGTRRLLMPKFSQTAPCNASRVVHRANFTASSQPRETTYDGRTTYQEALVKDIRDLAEARKLPIPRQLQEKSEEETPDTRLPKNLVALYAAPLKREPTHGIVVCDLQLRSYTARSVELMADFALRAAYYLNLPASGPVPLPKITNRWTVPRDAFIFKKSQENFERITLRRLIQIKDGHPDVVQIWLSYVRKHCFYGVGMKANVYEHESLGVAERMDKNEAAVESGLQSTNWDLVETTKQHVDEDSKFSKLLDRHGTLPSAASHTVPEKVKGVEAGKASKPVESKEQKNAEKSKKKKEKVTA